MSLSRKAFLIIIIMLFLTACKNANQQIESNQSVSTDSIVSVESEPILDIEILLNCNNTSYAQVKLAEKINAFGNLSDYIGVWELLNTAVNEMNDTLSENIVTSIYQEIDKHLYFDSLFVETVRYNSDKNILTEYAFDIFKLDLTTGIIHKQSLSMGRAQQSTAKWIRSEFERHLMMKYYNLLYDKIENFHINRDPDIIKPSKVHLSLEKNQKQWEELKQQKEKLFWDCLEHGEGTWSSVSYPGLGYYRERISFLFDCYMNYNETTRYNYKH